MMCSWGLSIIFCRGPLVYRARGWLNLCKQLWITALVSVPLLQLIETRLADHSPGRKLLRRLMKRSAVAMILQVREGELHIL